MRKNCSGPIIYLRAVGHIAVLIHRPCRSGTAEQANEADEQPRMKFSGFMKVGSQLIGGVPDVARRQESRR